MAKMIDADQHLVESRDLWLEHADPGMREDALRIVDDDLGYPVLQWRGRRIGIAEVQTPGETSEIGERHRRMLAGLPASVRYDDALPRDHWDPVARAHKLDELGVDEAILFPNYGLLWERRLHGSLPALHANMAAWNRWCASVAREGRGRLHPVAHLCLRDGSWLETQLAQLERDGIHLAMVAPALVEGRPLSHPDHDRLWAAFCRHGISPVFHVADQPRAFDDAWYTDEAEAFVPALEAVFLYTPAALACTDLILNGVLERFPDLRLGIVELSAVWVPLFLMMLDGGWEFTSRLNGVDPGKLPLRPSEYFKRQVRVSSFAYEGPVALEKQLRADILMCCSDYPHSEGTRTPGADYARAGLERPEDAPAFFAENARYLLHAGP